MRWIPAGDKGSNYDAEGNKTVGDKKQAAGSEMPELGVVEIYPDVYTHPIDTPVSDYVLEMKTGDTAINTKKIPKEED